MSDTPSSEDTALSEEEQKLFDNLLKGGTGGVYKDFSRLIPDPVALAYILCPQLTEGTHKLHPWQIESLMFLSTKNVWTKQDYLKYYLAACNGSGKDAYIIALLAVYFSLTIQRHRTVISTASYNQLSRQTEPYIRSLSISANTRFPTLFNLSPEEKVFLPKRGHIVSPFTGSEIVLFVTDDPGRAEGFHPWPDCPTQELCLIINEAKTIPEEIFEAFSKCTYNRWIEVSSTGTSKGHFYSEFRRAFKWDEYKKLPLELRSNIKNIARRVTAHDCKHISEERINRAIESKGRNSYHVKTTFFSEFASIEGSVAIDRDVLDNAIDFWKNAPEKKRPKIIIPRRAGFDIGGGRAESVIIVTENAKVIGKEAYTDKNTTKTVLWALSIFNKYSLKAEAIFGDDNGIGQAVIDELYRREWQIKRVRNQSPAFNKNTYGNLGAELYGNACEIISKHLLDLGVLADDEDFKEQISTRRIEPRGTFDKLFLESKTDLLADNRPSPDRADAFVLSLAGLTWQDFKDATIKLESEAETNDLLEVERQYQRSLLQQKKRTLNRPPPTINRLLKAGDSVSYEDMFARPLRSSKPIYKPPTLTSIWQRKN